MPQVLDKKVGEWRDADRKARELEMALTRLRFSHDERPLPAELVRQAKLLRQLANEKLKAAIAAMKPDS